MRVGRGIGIAAVCACLLASGARTDEWPGAVVTEVFSASRDWFVRVVPGTSVGETQGFAGAARGRHARAEWYRREADRSYRFVREDSLANPVAPVKFLVTDRGYLVTLDNWHNMGYGVAVASYRPDGSRVAGLTLADLFSKEEIAAFRTSVSSIWWRTETAYVREGQRSVYLALSNQGDELIYEPETGRWQQCAWRGKDHLCRTSNEAREWRPYREPPDSTR